MSLGRSRTHTLCKISTPQPAALPSVPSRHGFKTDFVKKELGTKQKTLFKFWNWDKNTQTQLLTKQDMFQDCCDGVSWQR